MKVPDFLKLLLKKYLKDFIATGLKTLENTQGLGLNIVKKYCRITEGTISISNRLNKEVRK